MLGRAAEGSEVAIQTVRRCNQINAESKHAHLSEQVAMACNGCTSETLVGASCKRACSHHDGGTGQNWSSKTAHFDNTTQAATPSPVSRQVWRLCIPICRCSNCLCANIQGDSHRRQEASICTITYKARHTHRNMYSVRLEYFKVV